jgi:hypothetical protein
MKKENTLTENTDRFFWRTKKAYFYNEKYSGHKQKFCSLRESDRDI